jgi:hypothetical protein
LYQNKKPTEIGKQSLQPTHGFLTPTKYLQTNLIDIKVEEELISQEHSSAT